MSKKYYLVKDLESQNGGQFYPAQLINPTPVKILRTEPYIFGAPIIKLTPFFKSTIGSKIEIETNDYNFRFEMPYFMVRQIVNDFFKYDRLLPNICDNLVKVKVVSPGLNTTIYTNEYVLSKVLRKIDSRYETKPSFRDQYGKSISLKQLLSLFDCGKIREKSCKEEKKECKELEEEDDDCSPETIKIDCPYLDKKLMNAT